MYRIGSLFSGYGGLDMAVEQFFGAETVWCSDIDKGASKILAHRWPARPNLGDITKVDWATVEPVDILTGGFPCQDLSHAGKRAGMRPGTRSALWTHMAYAVEALRPRYVIAENVGGLLSGCAHSDLEPCKGCLGTSPRHNPVLRGLGRVLGDLAALGYDAQWTGIRASDVGAPHGRHRIFVVAGDTDRSGSDWWSAAGLQRETGSAAGSGRVATDTQRGDRDGRTDEPVRRPEGRTVAVGDSGRVGDLTNPTGESGSVGNGDDVQAGRGTVRRWAPAGGSGVVRDSPGFERERSIGIGSGTGGSEASTGNPGGDSDSGWDVAADPVCIGFQGCDKDTDAARAGSGTAGCGVGGSGVVADPAGDGRHERRTEPARVVGGSDAAQRGCWYCGESVTIGTDCDNCGAYAAAASADAERIRLDETNDPSGTEVAQLRVAVSRSADIAWGVYEPAIRRWERICGRVAPAPTEASARGSQRLSPAFVEWMMGLPAGHVTTVPQLSRNDQLKALGNGVVPQQAYAALGLMLNQEGVQA